MSEQFTNNAQTTLSAAIDNTVVSFTVASVSTFPTSGNFRIVIDSEIFLVSSVDTTNNILYVTRGYESTTATAHNVNAPVTQVLTEGSLTTAFARLDTPNDESYVNGANQLVQTDSSGLLPEEVTADIRYLYRRLVRELVAMGFEFSDPIIEDMSKLDQ